MSEALTVDIDLIIWFGGLLFTIFIWIVVASQWGFVRSMDESGFVMRTLLMTRRVIPWQALDESVQQVGWPLPRIIVRMRDRGFMKLHTSFAVLLRDRPMDRAFVEAVRMRHRVVPVENIQDLMKW